jgi:hypothetical protein
LQWRGLLEDDQKLLQRDVGQLRDDRPLDDVGARLQHVTFEALESVDVACRLFEPFVLLQAPDELRAWVVFLVFSVGRPR